MLQRQHVAMDCYKDALAIPVCAPTMKLMKKAAPYLLGSLLLGLMAKDVLAQTPPYSPPWRETPHQQFRDMSPEERERLREEREQWRKERREQWQQLSPEERHQLRRDIREAGRFYRRGPWRD